MKVSFITTVFNEEKNIKDFIESIIHQTKKPDEIIIVDGGSTDKTYEIIKDLSKKNKKIKIYQEKGANIARGRNIAISHAKGEVILASDAGCVVDKNWAKETLKYFPKEDVVAGSSKAITNNDFEFFQALLTLKKVDRPSRMSSRNIAFKKKCWEKVGGYPEKSLTGEDNRFDINLMEAGYEIKVNPKKHVSWEMRPTLFQFAKQYYNYGKGDRVQGNLFKKTIKKNLFLIFGFWLYLIIFLSALSPYPLLSIYMVIIPLIILELYALFLMAKTKKISALLYVPTILITKRFSYVMGATFK